MVYIYYLPQDNKKTKIIMSIKNIFMNIIVINASPRKRGNTAKIM